MVGRLKAHIAIESSPAPRSPAASSTCTTSRSSTSSPRRWWRSRPLRWKRTTTATCARALRQRGRGGGPHRADRGTSCCSGPSGPVRWRAGRCHHRAGRHQRLSGAAAARNLAEHLPSTTRARSFDAADRATESAVFERREAGAQASQRRSPNCASSGHIAIDDFGTGYRASHPGWRVDTLKIDHSFVRDLVTDADPDRERHHRHGAPPAHRWSPGHRGLAAAGEAAHARLPYAQGYLFARPSPAAGCIRYLTGVPLDAPAPAGARHAGTPAAASGRPRAQRRPPAAAPIVAFQRPPAPGSALLGTARMRHGFGPCLKLKGAAPPAVRGRGAHGAAEGLRL